jgi:hypothetical protein
MQSLSGEISNVKGQEITFTVKRRFGSDLKLLGCDLLGLHPAWFLSLRRQSRPLRRVPWKATLVFMARSSPDDTSTRK